MPRSAAKKLDAAEPLAMRTCRELIRTFGLFERVMQPYFARYGISGSQWGVLRQLQRAEAAGLPGLRGADLSDRLLIRPPSVTGVVDRLTRAGLVERRASSGDQRAKLVRLTERGRELVARILKVHSGQTATVTAALQPAEQAELQRLLARLGLHLQDMIDRGSLGPHLHTEPVS